MCLDPYRAVLKLCLLRYFKPDWASNKKKMAAVWPAPGIHAFGVPGYDPKRFLPAFIRQGLIDMVLVLESNMH